MDPFSLFFRLYVAVHGIGGLVGVVLILGGFL